MYCNQLNTCFARTQTGECDCLNDETAPYPVGKCPFQKPVTLDTIATAKVRISADKVEARRKDMKLSRWTMSELSGRACTWWDTARKKEMMRRDYAINLANALGVKMEDLLV